MSRPRTVAAFLVAPLIVPFVFYIPFPGESAGASNLSGQGLLFGPLLFAVYALPIAYFFEFFFGLPAWIILRCYGVRSLPAFAGTGALIGWLVNLAIQTSTGNLATRHLAILFNPLDNPYILICVVAASGSALVFRTVVFSGEAARETRSEPTSA